MNVNCDLLTSRPHRPPCDLATQSGSILRLFYCQTLHSQIMSHWRNSQKVWKVCETMNQNFISTPFMFIKQMKCNSIFESLKLINPSQSVAHSSARSVSLSRHFNLELRPAFSYGHTLLDTNLYFSSKSKWITLHPELILCRPQYSLYLSCCLWRPVCRGCLSHTWPPEAVLTTFSSEAAASPSHTPPSLQRGCTF